MASGDICMPVMQRAFEARGGSSVQPQIASTHTHNARTPKRVSWRGIRAKITRRALWSASLLICATIEARSADPRPRSVLFVDQLIPYTEYFGKLVGAFQAKLKAESDAPVTFYSENLEYSHFRGPQYD